MATVGVYIDEAGRIGTIVKPRFDDPKAEITEADFKAHDGNGKLTRALIDGGDYAAAAAINLGGKGVSRDLQQLCAIALAAEKPELAAAIEIDIAAAKAEAADSVPDAIADDPARDGNLSEAKNP